MGPLRRLEPEWLQCPPVTPLYSLLLALDIQHGGGSQVPRRLPGAVQVAQGSNSIALQGPLAAWRGRQEGLKEGGQFPSLGHTPELLTTVEGDPGSLTEASSRKGALGTAPQASGMTPPLPPATSC